MFSTSDNEKRVKRLIKNYGRGADGSSPTSKQWQALLSLPATEPVSLINFFKMRERARYPRGSAATPCSGEEAFQRYASVSGGALEQVGGQFLLVSPFKGGFVGQSEDWDLVAIGTYPNPDKVLSLFENADYQQAYVHRTAACARQAVVVT